MKWIPGIAIVTAIGGAVLYWAHDVRPPHAVSSDHRGDSSSSRRTIFAGGIVEGARRDIPLDFEISGRLASIEAREGARVKRGDVLARLDDASLRYQLAQARAKLKLAKAQADRLVNGAGAETRKLARTEAALAAVQVARARKNYQRAFAAREKNALTSQDFDDYRFKLEIAEAELARAKARAAEVEARARSDELEMAKARILLAQAEVDQARTTLEKAVLRAPTDGVVARVDAEPGELITEVRDQPLVVLVDDRIIRVRAYVEELDVFNLEVGQRARIAADGLQRKHFTGTIRWIAPSLHAKRHRHNRPGERTDVKVREVLIHVEDPGPLVVGLRVDVFIEPDKPPETTALALPIPTPRIGNEEGSTRRSHNRPVRK